MTLVARGLKCGACGMRSRVTFDYIGAPYALSLSRQASATAPNPEALSRSISLRVSDTFRHRLHGKGCMRSQLT